MLSLAPYDRVFYRIAAPGGETITGYSDLPAPETIGVTGHPQFFDATYRGEMVRFGILGRLVVEPAVQGWATVQVGQTRRAREALARSIARSEEHTSELQSLMRISYAVFCLQKKKTKTNTHTHMARH